MVCTPCMLEGNEQKTFWTRYRHYEDLVILFDLFYALTAFHCFVNDVLHSLLDDCVVLFLASSCSPVLNRHTDYAREVLSHLQQW